MHKVLSLLTFVSLVCSALSLSHTFPRSPYGIRHLNQTAKSIDKLYYGVDNRAEPYLCNDNVKSLASADVAVMDTSSLVQNGDGTWKITADYTFDDLGGCELCSGEPYKGQYSPAYCSGFLVSGNQIATAGHCVDDNGVITPASAMAFIFDFQQIDSNTDVNMDSIPNDNVYFGSSHVHQLTSTQDWAVVTLDRAAVNRTPVPLRQSGTVDIGTPLILVGHPSGLPLKIADGATVQEVDAYRFYANTDSYAGNSGSMVVNENTWTVEGILIEGNQDFVQDGTCCKSNHCPDTGCGVNGSDGVEVMTQIQYILSAVTSPATTLSIVGDFQCTELYASAADKFYPATSLLLALLAMLWL